MTEPVPIQPETDTDDEVLVPEDDTVIARAFKVSLFVIGGMAAIAAAVLLLLREGEPPAPEPDPVIEAPGTAGLAARAPAVRFTDVTAAAGIDFVHENGARGGKYLPETMGGGCAFLDHDGDGDQDLLLVNATPWPWDAGEGAAPAPTQALYRNDGRGHFESVTAEAGLDVVHYGMGVATGDIDGDGDVDVLLTGVGGNRLFRNDDGRFVETTREAGVGGPEDAWTTSAGFCDLDGDGDLDCFVCHYVRWSKAIDEQQDYTLEGVGRAYGPPNSFEGVQSTLYRNEGDGTFRDVSAEAGIHIVNDATGVPVGKALALAFADLDEDGDMDVFVANDTVRNFLFRNDGGLRFTEMGEAAGVAYDSRGAATGAMGTDVAEIRDDGVLGIAVGNFASEMSSLYLCRNRGMQFIDCAISEGIGAPSRRALSCGVLFMDYDLDGRLDFFQTNGHLEEEINKVQPSQHYEQPSQLFWNVGPDAPAAFAEVDPETLGDLTRPVVGRGCAYADIDGDGDLDLLVTQAGRRPLLLRNDQALRRHWLRVRLDGAGRSPIGALVTCAAGGRVQRRRVMPTRSYLSQVELPVTFGLGANERVDALTVTWPDGTAQAVPVEGLDREILVARE